MNNINAAQNAQVLQTNNSVLTCPLRC